MIRSRQSTHGLITEDYNTQSPSQVERCRPCTYVHAMVSDEAVETRSSEVVDHCVTQYPSPETNRTLKPTSL